MRVVGEVVAVAFFVLFGVSVDPHRGGALSTDCAEQGDNSLKRAGGGVENIPLA
jgi:hypothetical protein